MQGIQRLPEELLAEILSHLMSLSPGAFAGFQYHDFIPSDYYRLPAAPCPRRAHLLLVCKQWHRIGMSLLYESIIVKNSAHVGNVVSTLVKRPDVAQHVRRIAISGGMGPPLDTLLSMVAGSVHTLKLQIYVGEKEDVTGICRGLSQLSPSRLLLEVRPQKYSAIEGEKKVVDALVSAMGQWKSLGRVDLVRAPDQWLYIALQQSTSLQHLCLSRFEAYAFAEMWTYSQKIVALPAFKCVIARDLDLRAAAAQRKVFETAHPLVAKYVVSDQEQPELSMMAR